MALAEELVGIADDFLFERLWQKVLKRKRQLLPLYFLKRDARSGMAFADPGMTRQSFGAQHCSSLYPMPDIRLRAKTMNGRGVTADDADIMKHGSLDDKRAVQLQLGM